MGGSEQRVRGGLSERGVIMRWRLRHNDLIDGRIKVCPHVLVSIEAELHVLSDLTRPPNEA